METMPSAAELIEAAIESIRAELLPALGGRAAFQARVIVNVLDIARREVLDAPAADAAEGARLRRLLAARDEAAPAARPGHEGHEGHEGHPARGADAADAADAADPTDPTDAEAPAAMPVVANAGPVALPGLRRALCDAIRDGRLDAATPGLADHLWADVLARVAIDQPTYPSFVREAATRTRD